MTMANAPLAAPLRAQTEAGNGMFALLVFLGLLALFLALGDRLLNDPDTYWHIAVGERIWATGSFPQTDELSHTFAGSPWIAKEWLSQVILFAAHAAGGWWGVAVLAALTAAASFALLFAWLSNRLQPTAAFAIVSLVALLAAGQVLARPHLFAFPLLMLWVGGLVSAVERGASPPWWLVAVIALWANFHASFPIAFLLAGLLAMEAIRAAPAAARVRTAVDWAVFGLAALLASGLTPYGYQPAVIAFRLMGSNEAQQFITEWQPLSFDPTGVIALAALLGSLALLAGAPRRNLFRIAIVLLCGYLMVTHVRFTSLFGIVAALLVAAPLAGRFAVLRPQPAAAFSQRPHIGALGCLVLLLIGCGTLAAMARPAPNPVMTPAAALAAARAMGVSGPVFNEYDFGGYLIWQGVPTFIDGRADQIFLGGFITEIHHSATSPDKGRFPGLLDRYGVTWALVRPASGEARRLDATADWSRVHEDPVAAVFVNDAAASAAAPLAAPYLERLQLPAPSGPRATTER